MTFNGFNQEDFNTFLIDGLSERMEAIKERIQPKFKEIFHLLEDDVNEACGHKMYLHIAQHARRTVNPPDDTWSAYCHNKRGYKKHPHFQIGLWEDHLFVWLAYIYESPYKKDIGKKFLSEIEDMRSIIPENYYISLDHTKNEASLLKDTDLKKGLERFYKVKKGEFLVGKKFKSNDPIVQDGDRLIKEMKHTVHTLAPIYRSSMAL